MKQNVRQWFMVWVLVMGCLVPAGLSGWDFTGRTLNSAVKEIAEKGKLNVIVPGEDRIIASFSASSTLSPVEALREMTAEIDYTAILRGDAFVLVPRKIHRQREGVDVRFFPAAERPVEWVAMKSAASLPADVSCVPYPEGNFGVLTGFSDDLDTAVAIMKASDVPAGALLVTLRLTDARPGGGTLSLRFRAIDQVPTKIECLLSPDRAKLSGEITVAVRGTDSYEFSGSLGQSLSAPVHWSVLSSPAAAGAHRFPDVSIRINGEEVVGSWEVAELPRSDRLAVASSTHPAVSRSPRPVKNPRAATEPTMRYSLTSVDAGDVYRTIVASAAGNLALHADCTERVSVHCFGSELYFEEFLSLVAKSVHHAVRKIGNTWQIAPVGMIADNFCTSDFVSKRLQHADAGKAELFCRNLANQSNLSGVGGLSSDVLINMVIYGGSREVFKIFRPLLEMMDSPPWLLAWRISSFLGTTVRGETIKTPTGRAWRRFFSDHRTATTSVELLPVVFGGQGAIGVRYQASCQAPPLSLHVNGWSFLDTATASHLLEVMAPGRFGLSLESAVAGSAASADDLAGDFSDEGMDDSPPMEDGEAGQGGFDDAFESAF